MRRRPAPPPERRSANAYVAAVLDVPRRRGEPRYPDQPGMAERDVHRQEPLRVAGPYFIELLEAARTGPLELDYGVLRLRVVGGAQLAPDLDPGPVPGDREPDRDPVCGEGRLRLPAEELETG